jgi:hypothetical protein
MANHSHIFVAFFGRMSLLYSFSKSSQTVGAVHKNHHSTKQTSPSTVLILHNPQWKHLEVTNSKDSSVSSMADSICGMVSRKYWTSSWIGSLTNKRWSSNILTMATDRMATISGTVRISGNPDSHRIRIGQRKKHNRSPPEIANETQCIGDRWWL